MPAATGPTPSAPPLRCLCFSRGFFFFLCETEKKPPKRCLADGLNESPVPSQNSHCGWRRVGWERGWGCLPGDTVDHFQAHICNDLVFMQKHQANRHLERAGFVCPALRWVQGVTPRPQSSPLKEPAVYGALTEQKKPYGSAGDKLRRVMRLLGAVERSEDSSWEAVGEREAQGVG